MEKGPDAYRTISEVADDLDLPQHVLRFWETRFPQIRPLKRGGGRRYYRPDDIELLRGIRHLLYSEGYTIRGVQRILKEEGPRYVQAIWRDAQADERAVGDAERRAMHDDGDDDDIDAGHSGRGEGEPRSGGLTGLLKLLPSRGREAEEPSRRGSKRRSEPESDYLELPLLPDLAPQTRPSRDVPRESARDGGPRVEPRDEFPPFDTPAPSHAGPPYADPFRPILPQASRANFPFRAVSEPAAARELDDETLDYVPAGSTHASEGAPASRPVLMRPIDDEPMRLSDEDVERLQSVLRDMEDCRRLLEAARIRKG